MVRRNLRAAELVDRHRVARDELANDAIYTESGVTVREAKDLWDMPAVFLLLALLLGAEWGYRRWRGLA